MWHRALIVQPVNEKPNIARTIRIFRARNFENFLVGISIKNLPKIPQLSDTTAICLDMNKTEP